MAKSCAVCGKSDGLKFCGGCKDRCYCSAGCQRSDWKTHKASCQKSCRKADGKGLHHFDPADLSGDNENAFCDFVLVAGKGAGAVAKAFIPAGEIIVQDQALLYVAEHELGISGIWSSTPADKVERKNALVKQQFEQLSGKEQAKVTHDKVVMTNWLMFLSSVSRIVSMGGLLGALIVFKLKQVGHTNLPP